MPHHPLAGVIEKVRRADAHLVALYGEIGDYLSSNPHTIECKRDPDNGNGLFILRLTREPPLRFATIVGDVLHNFRCAYDYIAAELIKANGFPTSKLTQFPICRTEGDFWNESINKGRLCGIALRPFNRIEALQPYRFGADKLHIHPLWHLHKLSNFDKHHTLNIVALGTKCEWRYIGREFGDHFVRQDTKVRLMQDGSVIGVMPRPFVEHKYKIEAQISTQVSFRDAPVAEYEVLSILQAMREFFTNFSLPLFEPFFDPLPDDLKLVSNGITETSLKGGRIAFNEPTIVIP